VIASALAALVQHVMTVPNPKSGPFLQSFLDPLDLHLKLRQIAMAQNSARLALENPIERFCLVAKHSNSRANLDHHPINLNADINSFSTPPTDSRDLACDVVVPARHLELLYK
jgi:hypothetical protein